MLSANNRRRYLAHVLLYPAYAMWSPKYHAITQLRVPENDAPRTPLTWAGSLSATSTQTRRVPW